MVVETPNRSAISPLKFFNRTARVSQKGPAIDKEKLTQIDYSLKGILSIKERTIDTSRLEEEESRRQEKEKKLEAGKFFVRGVGKLANAIPGKNTIQRFLLFMAFGWLFNTFSKYFGELSGPLSSIIGTSAKVIDAFSKIAFGIFNGFATFIDIGYKTWDVIRGTEDSQKLQGALNDVILGIDSFFGGILSLLGIVERPPEEQQAPQMQPGTAGPTPAGPGAPPSAGNLPRVPQQGQAPPSSSPTPQAPPAQVSGGIIPSQAVITSGYGAQESFRKKPHTGIDYGYDVGTPISLIKGGIVVEASTGYNGGYGNFVLIRHSDGKYSMFNHLDKIYVQKGQKISGIIKLWDVGTSREIRTLRGHTGAITSLAFSPDGRILGSGGNDRTIRLWDVATGHELRNMAVQTDGPSSVAFSPDGKMIANGSGGKDVGSVEIWATNTGKKLKDLQGHQGKVVSVAFSPDGRQLISSGEDNRIQLWDVTTKLPVKILSGGISEPITHIVYDPDGKKFVYASYNGTIKLWDPETSSRPKVLNNPEPVTSVEYSPNGKMFVSGGLNKNILLWDARTGRKVHDLKGHTNNAKYAQFSPDGKLVVSASDDKTVRLWDVGTGTEIRKFTGHNGPVEGAFFSPNGKLIASWGFDRKIRLWNAENGHEIKNFRGHTGAVWVVKFSPDGKMLLSTSQDKTIRLWDVESGREIRTLRGHA
jgi:WD40 repeat protein